IQGVDAAAAWNRRRQTDRGDPASARQPVHHCAEGGFGHLMTADGDSPVEPAAPGQAAPNAVSPGVSRRGVLTSALWAGLGGAALGAAAGGSAAFAMASSHGVEDTIDLHGSYPFYGQGHQGGIA